MNKNIAEQIMKSSSINLSKYDEAYLNKSIQNRIVETNCSSIEEYCILLERDDKEIKIFIESLHIGYTEFFRNPLTFEVLDHIVLPMLIQKMKNSKRKELRIWSAACATGQEAYSLAILLEELKSNESNSFAYRIFATDKCGPQLEEAMKGKYVATTLKNISLKRAEDWFTMQGDIFTVKPELKENINFSVFDLFDDQLICPPASIFGDFDLVVCANLLFYYKPEFRKQILEKINNCITIGGYFATGETEREIVMNYDFHEIFPQSAIFQNWRNI